MGNLFEREIPEGSRECSCCKQVKPVDDFYICNGKPQKKCKQCTSVERKAKILYDSNFAKDFVDWPEELQAYAKYYFNCQKAGGKVDYKNSAALDLITRYMVAADLAFEDEPEVGKECLLALTKRVQDLEDKISALQSAVEQAVSSTKKKSAQDIQERRNLLNKISMNPLLVDYLGSDEDANKFCERLLDAARKCTSLGYLPGGELRQILLEFEYIQEPFFDDILIFYRKYLEQGIEATRDRDDYDEQASITESLLGYNAYDIDWADVPVSTGLE